MVQHPRLAALGVWIKAVTSGFKNNAPTVIPLINQSLQIFALIIGGIIIRGREALIQFFIHPSHLQKKIEQHGIHFPDHVSEMLRLPLKITARDISPWIKLGMILLSPQQKPWPVGRYYVF